MAAQGDAMYLLVAIPCFNDAETIRGVISRIPKEMAGVSRISVLVVDDGSEDNCRAEAEAAGALVVSHGQNLGVGAAFHTALDYAVSARSDILVNIDADGQFMSEDIPKLISPIIAGEAQFVTASRFIDQDSLPEMPWIKLQGNRLMSALISRLTGSKFHDVSCGFRAYSREAMLRLNLHGRFTYTQESFLDLSYKNVTIRELPVAVKYFADRKSRVASSIPRYAIRTLFIIFRIYRDYYPIRFFWGLASLFLLTGMATASILLLHYLRYGAFSGQIWAGFTGGFLIAIGLLLVVLGIVADMLDRGRRNQERILYLLKRTEARDLSELDGEPVLSEDRIVV